MSTPSSARWLAVALPAALVTLACSDSGPTQTLPVATVTVTPGQGTLSALGATQQLTAVARDANGTSVAGKTFVWTSSALGIASVDATGLVTAQANGLATITATADGVAGTAQVTVAQTVATIFVLPNPVGLLGVGATSLPLNAVAYDGNDNPIAGVAFTWSSADASVATISTAGVATAHGLGTTTIAAASGGVTGTTTLTVSAHFYVNAATGNDANKGTTAAAPFKRITQALSVAAAGNTIKVLPGLYDVAGNGESFPLLGPPGVILLGDELNKGGGPTPTEVLGDDLSSISFFPPANAVIAGFTITHNGQGDAVLLGVDGVTLRSNRISSRFSRAVTASAPSTGVITGNVITGGTFGIDFCGGPGLRIEHNTITNNQVGVFSNCGTGDLGGGSAGSAGGNVIACNTNSDVNISSGATVMAAGNRWDHAPPTVSATGGGGVDIVVTNGSSVVTTGAALAPSPCP